MLGDLAQLALVGPIVEPMRPDLSRVGHVWSGHVRSGLSVYIWSTLVLSNGLGPGPFVCDPVRPMVHSNLGPSGLTQLL